MQTALSMAMAVMQSIATANKAIQMEWGRWATIVRSNLSMTQSSVSPKWALMKTSKGREITPSLADHPSDTEGRWEICSAADG
jgi:hypothetical protein